MTARVGLWFSGDVSPELVQFKLSHPLLPADRVSSRGKTGGARKGNRSFQWTPAVQSLSLLFVRFVTEFPHEEVALRGGYGSPATSLDFAINKQPAWLLDMFGLSADGACLVHRIISRTNPGSKRPGPVELTVNASVLSPGNIEVYLNGERLERIESLRAISKAIETVFHKSVEKRSKSRGVDNSDTSAYTPNFLPLEVEAVSQFIHPLYSSELRSRFSRIQPKIAQPLKSSAQRVKPDYLACSIERLSVVTKIRAAFLAHAKPE